MFQPFATQDNYEYVRPGLSLRNSASVRTVCWGLMYIQHPILECIAWHEVFLNEMLSHYRWFNLKILSQNHYCWRRHTHTHTHTVRSSLIKIHNKEHSSTPFSVTLVFFPVMFRCSTSLPSLTSQFTSQAQSGIFIMGPPRQSSV
jgi:hypothetical protein